MTTRKKTTARRKTGSAQKGRRRAAAGKNWSGRILNYVIPFAVMASIILCLLYLLGMGYQSAAASSFFDVKRIDVQGVRNAPKEEIENIVSRQSAATGVWNANLAEIKRDIEKLNYVRSASVSRVLPDRIRVIVVEREPRAVIVLESGDYWVDEDAVLLGKVEKVADRPPFVIKGWDETKSLRTLDENKERVKIYLRMLAEWQDFEIARRVTEVDLKDLNEIKAVVRDSGQFVTIGLGKDDFGINLREALKKIANKGKEIKSFDALNSVALPRDKG